MTMSNNSLTLRSITRTAASILRDAVKASHGVLYVARRREMVDGAVIFLVDALMGVEIDAASGRFGWRSRQPTVAIVRGRKDMGRMAREHGVPVVEPDTVRGMYLPVEVNGVKAYNFTPFNLAGVDAPKASEPTSRCIVATATTKALGRVTLTARKGHAEVSHDGTPFATIDRDADGSWRWRTLRTERVSATYAGRRGYATRKRALEVAASVYAAACTDAKADRTPPPPTNRADRTDDNAPLVVGGEGLSLTYA